jgi:hypothetical protein
MELKELRRMTMPKLRDLAKQVTDLQGVLGMEKEPLIQAIAKAQGISYDAPAKDANAIHSIKHDIRELKKQKNEILTSSRDRKKLKRMQRRIKLLKRLTRHLAHEAKASQAGQATQADQAAQPAAPPQAGAPAETPPATS